MEYCSDQLCGEAVSRRTHNPEVAGSNPVTANKSVVENWLIVKGPVPLQAPA